MTDDDLFEQHIEVLKKHQQQTEFKFVSGVPIVGPLISYFRSMWLSMAARWYVRHYAQQQQAYNQAVLDTLRLLSAQSKHRHEQITQTQFAIQQEFKQIEDMQTQEQIKHIHIQEQIEDMQTQEQIKHIHIQEQIEDMQKYVNFMQQTQQHDFETIAKTLRNHHDRE